MADDIEDIYPLTVTQQGMLLHALSRPQAGTFTEQLCWTLTGELRPDVLRRAWQVLIARETLLRAEVVWEGMDEPLLVVRGEADLPWTDADWSGRPEAGLPAQLDEMAERERLCPFDVTRGPLMRLVVVRLPGDRHRLLWTFHHLLIDGWSLALLVDQLAETYRCLAAGEPVPARRRPRFRDYVAWLKARDVEAAQRYWRNALAGVREPTPLGIDEVGPSEDRHVERYAEAEFAMPADVTAELVERARARRITLNTAVEASWARLLSAYTGRDPVLFGVTTSGRSASLPGIEAMVGMFINALPVHTTVPVDQPVWPWLSAFQHAQLGRQDYEWLPLVQIRDCAELAAGEPLFETALVFENYPLDPAGWRWGPKTKAGELHYIGGRANHPLTLFIFPGDRLMFRAVFDARRLPPGRVAALLRHLGHLLATIATGRDTTVGQWSPLDDAELRRLVAPPRPPGPPARPVAGPPPATVPELFARVASDRPEALAAVSASGALTYRNLQQRVSRLAALLKESP